MTTRRLSPLLLLLVAAALGGCRADAGDAAACGEVGSSADCALKCGAVAAAPAAAAPAVAGIVFVGKKDACECTRARIDASRRALDAVLAARDALPVRTLLVDTEAEQVAPLQAQERFVVLPAVYLLDGEGKVLRMLQGEITEEQFARALAPADA
jgi:hypothetical protein